MAGRGSPATVARWTPRPSRSAATRSSAPPSISFRHEAADRGAALQTRGHRDPLTRSICTLAQGTLRNTRAGGGSSTSCIESFERPGEPGRERHLHIERGSAGRECRRSGEPVDPVVVRIARVALDPHEGHVSPSVPYQTERPLPEVSVLDRAVRSLPGAIAQPPLVPVLVEALLDVGAVSVDFDGTSQRLERLADRGELPAG